MVNKLLPGDEPAAGDNVLFTSADRIGDGDEALRDGPRRKTNRQAPGQLVS